MKGNAALVNFEDYKSRIKTKSFEYDEHIAFSTKDLMIKLEEIANTINENQNSNQSKVTPHTIELERKCEYMKKNLENCIPYHTIIYLCVNAVIFGGAFTLLILNVFFNVKVIAMYYVFCTLIISSGLFFTALTSLKDWRSFVNDVK